MTKREFDALTKENWQGNVMASDERCSYRETRMLPHDGCGSFNPNHAGWSDDYLLRRAKQISKLKIATLDRGSPFRASQAYRLRVGKSLLGGRF